MNRRLIPILSWLVSILVVPVLVLGAVRIVINHWYVEFEYRTPGFPADEYGFTFDERLAHSKVAIDYLVNAADISFLGDLRFPAGQQAPPTSCQYMDDCTRLYNDRELSHMLDVKIVVQGSIRVLITSVLLLAVLGVWAWRGGWLAEYRLGLSRGGLLTLVIIGSIILFVLLAFGVIFVWFHQIFFSSGTWMFFTSDTLIRLFPERFWRDTFLMVGGLTTVFSLLTWLLLRPRKSSE